MPSEVFQKASTFNQSPWIDICSLLCTEINSNSIKLVCISSLWEGEWRGRARGKKKEEGEEEEENQFTLF
jgi:hypothetical protein